MVEVCNLVPQNIAHLELNCKEIIIMLKICGVQMVAQTWVLLNKLLSAATGLEIKSAFR